MTRFFKIKTLFFIGLFTSLSLAAAGFKEKERLNISENQTENVYGSAKEIWADFTSTDDVYLAGGKIYFSGSTSEDLFLAGGDIDIKKMRAGLAAIAGGNIFLSGSNVRELLLAGGNVKVDNVQVRDDMILAGGKIDAGALTTVSGSLTASGGDLVFNGKVSDNASFTGNTVTLSGEFSKDVKVISRKLFIRSGTVIHGNFEYSAENVDISPEAKIIGKTTVLPPIEKAFGPKAVLGSLWFILVLIGFWITPAIISVIFEKRVLTASEEVLKNFWSSLGKGLVAVVIIPIILILLIATGIGFPIAATMLLFVIVLEIIACAAASFTLGQIVMKRFSWGASLKNRKKMFGYAFVGAMLMYLLLLIPLIGFVAVMIFFMANFGSLLTTIKNSQFRSE